MATLCFVILWPAFAGATTYYQDYTGGAFNVTETIVVPVGVHDFQIDGITTALCTEWYVNGVYTGSAQNDCSSFPFYYDPEYTLFVGGSLQVQGLVYEVNSGVWTLIEIHTWNLLVDTVPPSVPSLSSPSNGAMIDDATPSLDWTDSTDPYPSSGFDEYQVQVDNNDNFSSPTFDATPSASQDTTSLLTQGWNYWRVRAADNEGNWSSWSGTRSFFVDSNDPDEPSLLDPPDGTLTTDSTVSLDWSNAFDTAPSSGIDYYQVQVDNSLFFSSPEFEAYPSGSSTTTDSLPDDEYSWRVRARDNAGNWSSWARGWEFTIDDTPPSQPSLLSPGSGAVITSSSVSLDWSGSTDPAPGSGFDRFQVQVDDSASFASPIFDDQPVSSSATVSFLPDDQYFWRVRVGDNAGNWSSWTSAFEFTVDANDPTIPTLLAPAADEHTIDSTPLFQWSDSFNAGTGVERYQLIVETAFFGFNQIDVEVFDPEYLTPDALALGAGGAEYDWRVRARDYAGNWSDWTPDRRLHVEDPPELIVGGLSVSPATVAPGEQFTVTYALSHEDTNLVDVFFGCSIILPGGVELNSPDCEAGCSAVASIPPGVSAIFTRCFTVPSSASEGLYEVFFAIWEPSGCGPGIQYDSYSSFDLTVQNPCSGSPTIDTSPIPLALVGEPFTHSMVASGGEGALTWSLDPGSAACLSAAGLSFSSAGVISGDPQQPMSCSLSIQVCDSCPLGIQCDSVELDLQVQASCIDPPTVDITCPIATTVGTPFEVLLEAGGGEGALSWSLVDPTCLNDLDFGLSPAGVLSGTPTQEGFCEFEIQVCDSCPNGPQCATLVCTLVVEQGSPCVLDASLITSSSSAVGTILDLGGAPGTDLEAIVQGAVDWNGCTPGQVRFDWSSGYTDVVDVVGSVFDVPFDLQEVLTFGENVEQNLLTITAISTDGLESLPMELPSWFGGQIGPDWLTGDAWLGGSVGGLTYDVSPSPLRVHLGYELSNFGEPFSFSRSIPAADSPVLAGDWGLAIQPILLTLDYYASPENPASGQAEFRMGSPAFDSGEQLGSGDLFMLSGASTNFGFEANGSLAVSADAAVNPALELDRILIESTLDAEIQFPVHYFVPYPVYITGRLFGGVNPIVIEIVEASASEIGDSGFEFVPHSATFTLGGEFTAGAGARTGSLTILGVEGSLTLIGTMELDLGWESGVAPEPSLALELLGSVTAYFLAWEAVYAGTFATVTWEPGSDPVFSAPFDFGAIAPLTSNWQLTPRTWHGISEPYHEPVPFAASLGPSPSTTLITNVYPRTRTSLALTNGPSGTEAHVALTYDDPTVSDPNLALEIVTARESGGVWSDSLPVTSDTVPDFAPWLATDATGALVAVWNRFATAAVGDDRYDLALKGEVAFSVFDDTAAPDGSWSAPVLLTSNSVADLPPVLVLGEDGVLRAFWLQTANPNVDPFDSISLSSDLYSAEWDSGSQSFSTPVEEISGLTTDQVPSIFVDTLGDVWAVWEGDTDQDSTTVSDREIFFRRKTGGVWEPEVQLTANGLIETGPTLGPSASGAPMLLWIETGQEEDRLLQAEWTGSEWGLPSVVLTVPGISNLALRWDSIQSIWAVWTAGAAENAGDVWAARYDAGVQAWTEPVQVTDDDDVEQSPNFHLHPAGGLAGVYVKRDFDDSGPSPTLGTADLVYLDGVATTDLFVPDGGLRIAPEVYGVGDTVTLEIDVRNYGLLSAPDFVEVQVLDESPGVPSQDLGIFTLGESIPGGATATVYVDFVVPAAGMPHSLRVEIDPSDAWAETDEANNEAQIGLLLPDLIGWMNSMGVCIGSGQAELTGAIENVGSASAGTSVDWELVNVASGVGVASGSVGDLAPGDLVSVTAVVPAVPSSYVFVVDPTNSVPESGEEAPFEFTMFLAGPACESAFVRGDCNGDGEVCVTDAVVFLYSFYGGSCTFDSVTCRQACDFNDDGDLDIADPIFLLTYLFVATPAGEPDPAPPGAPFPNCGSDLTPSALGCEVYDACP